MLRERLSQSLKEAMKSKDTRRVSTLRLILAALQDRDIAARGSRDSSAIADDEILQMLQTMVRQRRESVALYEQGGRADLVAQERDEIAIIESFLPRQLDAAEIEQAVERIIDEIGAAGIKDMGRTMATLKERYGGRMDFAKASGVVKRRLS